MRKTVEISLVESAHRFVPVWHGWEYSGAASSSNGALAKRALLAKLMTSRMARRATHPVVLARNSPRFGGELIASLPFYAFDVGQFAIYEDQIKNLLRAYGPFAGVHGMELADKYVIGARNKIDAMRNSWLAERAGAIDDAVNNRMKHISVVTDASGMPVACGQHPQHKLDAMPRLRQSSA